MPNTGQNHSKPPESLAIKENKMKEKYHKCNRKLDTSKYTLCKDDKTISFPLVSIGMPVYNGERYIQEAIDSLLAQDYPNFELVISDNASTDETPAICRKYAERDHRIKLHCQPQNVGAVKNFETVLNIAQGKYFMWAAADDRWHPEFIRTLVVELMNNPSSNLAMSACELINESGQLSHTVRFAGKDDPNLKSPHQLLKAATSWGKNKKKLNFFIYGLYSSRFLKSAMKQFIDTYIGDRLFVCQLALATRFRYIDYPLYIRRLHPATARQRYPEEGLSQGLNGFTGYLNIVLSFGRMLLKSKVIPLYRKIFIPEAMWRVWRFLTIQRTQKFKHKLKRTTTKRFKQLSRRFWKSFPLKLIKKRK